MGDTDEDVPTLTSVDAGNPGAKKPAFVVCPGGGYAGLAPHEGLPVAEWLESLGLRGFVLKYRLGPRYHHPAMLTDVERAIRTVRANAQTFAVDPTRVGVIGFSAGGHLASTVSTHGRPGNPQSSDPIDRASSRPDASVLIYPVVTMRSPYTHEFSREMLLGKNPDPKLIDSLSNERMVSLDTPPTFICHGANDSVVPIENSLNYALALASHHVPFETYIPEHGEHGFGMGATGSMQDWRQLCQGWLRGRGFIG